MSEYTPLASFRFTGAVRNSKIGEPTCAICGAQPASMAQITLERAETRCADHRPAQTQKRGPQVNEETR